VFCRGLIKYMDSITVSYLYDFTGAVEVIRNYENRQCTN
jgi:hypothetical protein